MVDGITIAVLDAGLHHHVVFSSHNPVFVPVPSRGRLRPERFDVVVVPFHTNHRHMARHKNELEGFVVSGGTLLVLGASDLAQSHWVPFCTWASPFTYETLITDHDYCDAIFGSMSGEDLRFHSKYHAHGELIPTATGMTTHTLAHDKSNRKVMVVFESPNGGSALVTSLDPDHHAAPNAVGPGKQLTEGSRAKAADLLRRLVGFACSQAVKARDTRVSGPWTVADPKRVFLSHKSTNKDLVRRFELVLRQAGFQPWIDEADMAAGAALERSILEGMRASCAAVFFVTPDFKDEKWLAQEIEYALQLKKERGEGFAIVTVVFKDREGHSGTVPDLLRRYVFKEPDTELDALAEILRALPLIPGDFAWRE